MTTHWSGKVVVITGASAGLGLAMAEAWAAAGARLSLAARGVQALESAADLMRRAGAEVMACPTDVMLDDQVQRLVARTVERFGRIDAWVNNVGKSARGTALDTTPDDFRQLFELNFISAVRCTRAAAVHLLAARGHLVNIGSLAAKSAARWMGAYAASKFALAAYTQQLRLELGPQGLHVMLVCPGPIARAEQRSPDVDQMAGLPPKAARPGAGVKTGPIDPRVLAERILRGCARRRGELIYPASARLMLAVGQLSSRWADRLIRWMT